MYEIEIKIDDIIANMTIEELEELKNILEQFKEIDEFTLKHIKTGNRQENDNNDIITLEAYEMPENEVKKRR